VVEDLEKKKRMKGGGITRAEREREEGTNDRLIVLEKRQTAGGGEERMEMNKIGDMEEYQDRILKSGKSLKRTPEQTG